MDSFPSDAIPKKLLKKLEVWPVVKGNSHRVI
jgi:hypothetical protein